MKNSENNNIININTNNSRFDLGAIMRRAWAIRSEIAARSGVCRMSVAFGACLRTAWAIAKGNAPADMLGAVAHTSAETTRVEFAALTGEAFRAWAIAATVRAARDEIGYSVEDKYLQFDEIPAFSIHNHDMDVFVSEAYIHVREALDRLDDVNLKRLEAGKAPRTLKSIVYLACRASIAKIWYSDIKHGRASVRTVQTDDGEYSYIDTMVASARDNTENAAIIRSAIATVAESLDDTSRIILAGIAHGRTERAIAEDVGLSSVAVHKRIVKIRIALKRELDMVA